MSELKSWDVSTSDNIPDYDKMFEGIIKTAEIMAQKKKAEVDLQKQIMLNDIEAEKEQKRKLDFERSKQSMEMDTYNQKKESDLNYQKKDADQFWPSNQDSAMPTTSPTPQPTQVPQAQPAPQKDLMGSLFPMTMGQQPQQNIQQEAPQAQPVQPPQQPMGQERPVVVDGVTMPHPKELYRAEGKITPQLQIYANAYKKFAFGGEGSDGDKSIMMKMVGLDKEYTGQGRLEKLGLDPSKMPPEELQTQLQQRDPGYANFMAGINEGRIKLGGRSSKTMNQVLIDASALYPGLDQSTAEARFKTRNGFASGKEAANIRSLRTAVQHLNELNNLIPALNNGKIRKYNSLKNYLTKEVGQPQVTKFKMTQNALAGELATIFKNTGGTDIEIANIKESIDMSDSIESLRGAVQQAMALMAGRSNSLETQWKDSFGSEARFGVIDAKTASILNKMGLSEYTDGDTSLEEDTTTVPKSKYSHLWGE